MSNVKPEMINVGDLMAFINYVKVKTKRTSDGTELVVEDLDNNNKEIKVTGRDLIEKSMSADQYAETKKVTKTEAAEILIAAHNRPLTVCFLKADNSERILRGRLIKHEALMGRSMCEDLDTTDAHRTRLVDHRTIQYIIVDNVKHVVK